MSLYSLLFGILIGIIIWKCVDVVNVVIFFGMKLSMMLFCRKFECV